MAATKNRRPAPQGPLYEFLRLSSLRADKGLSKAELARLANVAPNTLSSAEKRVGKKYETLMKIFNVLNSKLYYAGTLIQNDLIKLKKP
jgi:transcriptional regulator with XRE-family HTH domain